MESKDYSHCCNERGGPWVVRHFVLTDRISNRAHNCLFQTLQTKS